MTSRKPKSTKAEIVFNMKSVKVVDGELIIEGFANPMIVDRTREIMPKECWDLSSYEKTGMILFNHDRNKPIGKAIEVTPTDEGLYLKAKISKSKDPFIQMIRDLIKEGILNAFSVGFIELDHYKTTEGVKVITKADLFEISVVTVPTNQDAIFTVTSKQLSSMTYASAVRAVLQFKGANEALAVREKAMAANVSTDELAKHLTDNFQLRRHEAWDMLSGNKSLDDEKQKALSDMIDKKKKKPEDEASEKPPVDDKSANAEKPGSKEKPEGENPFVKEPKDGEEKAKQGFGEKPNPSDPNGEGDESIEPVLKKNPTPALGIQALLIPTSTAATLEEAVAVASSYGFTGIEEPIDGADGWIIVVRNEADFLDELATMTIGDGVLALTGVLVPSTDTKNDTGEAGPGEEGSENLPKKDESEVEENDEAEENQSLDEEGTQDNEEKPKAPDQSANDENAESQKPAADEEAKKKQNKKHFDSEVKSVESDSSFKPDWATNSKAWEKAQAASLAELGELRYAFIVTEYTKSGTAPGENTKHVIEGLGGEELDTNPVAASAKQTHALLGALIIEIQGLRQDVREQTVSLAQPRASSVDVNIVTPEPAPAQEPTVDEAAYLELVEVTKRCTETTTKMVESLKMLKGLT